MRVPLPAARMTTEVSGTAISAVLSPCPGAFGNRGIVGGNQVDPRRWACFARGALGRMPRKARFSVAVRRRGPQGPGLGLCQAEQDQELLAQLPPSPVRDSIRTRPRPIALPHPVRPAIGSTPTHQPAARPAELSYRPVGPIRVEME